MTACRCLVCGALLLLVVGVGHTVSHVIQCEELTPEERSTQCALYEYAQIADLAYGSGPAMMCPLGDTGAQVGIHNDLILELPDVLIGYEMGCEWRQYPLFESDTIEFHKGDDNVTRLACKREEDVRLSITWREFLVRSTLYIYFDIKFIAPVSVLLGNEEQIEVTPLRRIGPNKESDEEQLVAIKGTDFNKIPQVMASANNLLEPSGSCVFDVAAKYVAYRTEKILRDDEVLYAYGGIHRATHVAVVGHSLGGTAAQYLGALAATSDEYLKTLKHHENAIKESRAVNPRAFSKYESERFHTYSFNAIGLPEQSLGSYDASRHYSYVIDGEIASHWIGLLFEQEQIGHTVRYVPPDTWPGNSIVTLKGQLFQSDTLEPFRRHKIGVVQKAICECINGTGAVQGAPIWHEEGVNSCNREPLSQQ